MRRNLLPLLILTVVMMIGTVCAQGFELNPYGSGARAAGMGYAFTGVADDATAIAWNPAGLTQLYSMEASIIGRFGFGFVSTNYRDVQPDISIGSNFQLNFASFILPFDAGDLNFVGGVAFRRLYDFSYNETITISDFDYEQKTENKGGINAISPAIGIQVNDMLSFGGTINILTGSTDNKYTETSMGVESTEETSESYSGFSIEVGAMAKPNEKFSIGANFKIPHTITRKLEGQIEEDGIFYDAELEYDTKIPFLFDIGVGYRATEKVLLAFDYHHRPMKNVSEQLKKFTLEGVEVDLSDLPESTDIYEYNTSSIHFGIEYLAETGNSVMPLRLGVFTVPTVGEDDSGTYNDLTETYSGGEQIKFLGLSGGMGLVMDKIILDGSIEWILGSFVGDTEDYEGTTENVDYTVNDFRVTFGAVLHLGND